jgi:hypothetical protein
MLKVFYKIPYRILAKRLTLILPTIIGDHQHRFMAGDVHFQSVVPIGPALQGKGLIVDEIQVRTCEIGLQFFLKLSLKFLLGL